MSNVHTYFWALFHFAWCILLSFHEWNVIILLGFQWLFASQLAALNVQLNTCFNIKARQAVEFWQNSWFCSHLKGLCLRLLNTVILHRLLHCLPWKQSKMAAVLLSFLFWKLITFSFFFCLFPSVYLIHKLSESLHSDLSMSVIKQVSWFFFLSNISPPRPQKSNNNNNSNNRKQQQQQQKTTTNINNNNKTTPEDNNNDKNKQTKKQKQTNEQTNQNKTITTTKQRCCSFGHS